MSNHLKLTAQSLRILLILSLIAGIGLGVAGFVYGQRLLKDYAMQLNRAEIDATAGANAIESLQATESKLKTSQDVLGQITALRVTSAFPEFRIVDEVRAIASKNNLPITSFNYINTASVATGTATSTPSTGQTQAPTVKAAPVKKKDVIGLEVQLKNPVSYSRLLQFIYDIEQHLPKMQITSISLAPASDVGSSGTVNVSKLIVELYTK